MASTYASLTAAKLRTLGEARWLLVMRCVGEALIVTAEAAAPAVLVYRFGSIAGWSGPQVAMLLGLGRAGEGMALLVGRGVDPIVFSETVRMGRFDQVLTRPVSPLGWLLSTDVELRYAFRSITGLVIVAVAGHVAGVHPTVANVALLGLAALSCAVLVLAILIMGSALTFLTVEGSDIANLFANGGIGLASYPLDLYGAPLRYLFTFLIPVGLCVYVPVATVLGRPQPRPLGPSLLFALPAVLTAVVALAGLAWRAGLAHYQSTGS